MVGAQDLVKHMSKIFGARHPSTDWVNTAQTSGPCFGSQDFELYASSQIDSTKPAVDQPVTRLDLLR